MNKNMFQESVTQAYNLRDATWEIMIMLLVAFLLGYLLRRFLESPCEFDGAGVVSGGVISGKTFSSDDLKVVEGIGPAIEKLLKADGVNDWDDLANADVSQLQNVLTNAGSRFKMHNPKTWAEQADMARNGKWTELQEYQDFLDGGKDA